MDEKNIIKDMQKVAAQMRLDDIEENPDSEFDLFNCDCCAKESSLAGSIEYSARRLCNDCVLLAETAFALKKIKNIDEFMAAMEDKRLEELCEYIKEQEKEAKS